MVSRGAVGLFASLYRGDEGTVAVVSTVSIETPNELRRVIELIHDCWFESGSIVLDHESCVLTIPFQKEAPERHELISRRLLFFKNVRMSFFRWLLKIHEVEDVSIRDTERVGVYDFDEVKYFPSDGRVSITTGVPFGLEVTVRRLKITVEKTDEIVESKTVVRLF